MAAAAPAGAHAAIGALAAAAPAECGGCDGPAEASPALGILSLSPGA